MSPRQEQRAAASWAEAQRASEQMAHARQAAREITHERTESARVVGGVASRDATAECPLAESKDHAARAAEGTEESAARGREGQEWRGHGGEVP
jgi:hypothetical protein